MTIAFARREDGSSVSPKRWGEPYDKLGVGSEALGTALGLNPSRKRVVPTGLPIHKTSVPTVETVG